MIGDPDEKHEQGHYYQNLLLGPSYLVFIALLSVAAYWTFGGKSFQYKNFYTETWADAWS